jgi:hypothetical protein
VVRFVDTRIGHRASRRKGTTGLPPEVARHTDDVEPHSGATAASQSRSSSIGAKRRTTRQASLLPFCYRIRRETEVNAGITEARQRLHWFDGSVL